MPKPTKKSPALVGPRQKDSLLEQAINHPWGQLLGFAAFVFLVVLLVTSDFNQNERMLGELVVGDAAQRDIVATQDFTFLQRDEAALRLQKDLIASESPAVFDWQEGLGEQLRERITRGFSASRDAVAAGIDPRGAMPSSEVNARAEVAQRLYFGREVRSTAFDRHLGVQLRDSDFDAFARDGFNPRTESLLADVVGQVMSNIIVSSGRVLESERDRGIFLRRMRDGRVLIEYHVQDMDSRFVAMERTPVLVEETAAKTLAVVGDRELRNALVSAATSLIQPNAGLNQVRTLEKRLSAQNEVADQMVREEFRRGQILIHRGETVTERHRRQIDAMISNTGSFDRTQAFAGVVLFALLLITTLFVFGRKTMPTFKPVRRDLLFMAAAMVLLLTITRLGIFLGLLLSEQGMGVPADAFYYAIPVAAGGMLIRLVLTSDHASLFTIVLAMLVGVMADQSLYVAGFAALGGFVAAGTANQVKSRLALIWSGLQVGGVNVLMVISFLLIRGDFLSLPTFAYIVLALGGGLASGFLVSVLLPIVEGVFEYTTDVKLLELANLTHPAIRELIVQAPGSYHHSMMVGSLCEAAAEGIGCNPLLARVGAYYHDIGKAKNPHYFAENQKLGINPHDKLKPNMSALIIKAHVKDGLEVARHHRLPKAIQDFIAQHHGTSLIAYFYHKAKSLEDPEIQDVDENEFRYPGPKPRTRETAICLLADGVEAASRAMPDPTPARLKGLVQKMISKAFTDGQLDECGLTLHDLNKIAEAFNKILTGIYHHRPEYPAERKQERERVDVMTASAMPKKNKQKPQSEDEDASSDVWELTAERAKIEEENASGRHVGGSSGRSSGNGQTRKNDNDQGRESLPRLGSSGS